jgi:hypothetical protein
MLRNELDVECWGIQMAKSPGFFADDLNFIGTANAMRQKASSI